MQIAVLADLTWRGTPTKAMLWANRNGFFYVLDRTNGRFLLGTPFVKVNWASGLDAKGTADPHAAASRTTDVAGQSGRHQLVFAVIQSAHRADVRLGVGRLRVDLSKGAGASTCRDAISQAAGSTPLTPVPGAPGVRIGRATPINNWTDAVGHGTVMAIDPQTGQKKWTFAQYDVTDSGILTTATDLLFTGGREGYFYALDARTGARAVEGEPRRRRSSTVR